VGEEGSSVSFGPLCIGIACMLGGIFIITAIVLRWDWYVNHPWVKVRSARFGEPAATRHQIALGSGLVIVGMLMIGWFIFQAMGIMPPQ